MAIAACSTPTSNVIPYPDNKNSNTDNNYYYTHAHARELAEVAEMYQDTMGRPLPRYTATEVLELIQSGIQADMICAVLAYTAGAPRPSWAYARAVIERQAAQGARTAADFRGNVSSWRQQRAAAPGAAAPGAAAPAKRVIEQQYEQRTYSPEQYAEIPEELLREAAQR